MRSKQAIIAIIALALLVNACFFSSVSSQPIDDLQSIEVTLNTPEADTIKTDNFNVTFTFTPTIYGDDALELALLKIDDQVINTATNKTSLANNTANTIDYIFTQNGTYLWNIQLQNSTGFVYAAESFNITLSVYVPDPTSTPSPSPTPVPATATPVPATPTSTAHPTLAPTPTPTSAPETAIDTWTVVIIAVIAIIGVGAGVVLYLGRKK